MPPLSISPVSPGVSVPSGTIEPSSEVFRSGDQGPARAGARHEAAALAERQAAPAESPRPVDPERVREAAEHMNKVAQAFGVRARFSVYPPLKAVVVRVYDVETNEVIREIPPERLLKVAAKIQELAGILVDKEI